MAWLGEQFTSIRGKISDFTKDVILTDSAGGILSHDNNNTSSASSGEMEYLTQLCQQKDSKINNLLSQNQELENSIITLDEQNQEALSELLTIKTQLALENKELKKQLTEIKRVHEVQDVNCSDDSAFHRSYTNLSDMESIDVLKKELNIFTLLCPFNNSQSEDILAQQISRLTNAKALLETSTEDHSDSVDLKVKLSMYIEFLNLVCNNRSNLLPIVTETATFLHKLHYDENSSHEDGMSIEKHSYNVPTLEKVSSSCQTDTISEGDTTCSLTTHLKFSSTQTDECLSDDSLREHMVDSYCQTELKIPCSNCRETETIVDELHTKNEDLIKELDLAKAASVQTDGNCRCTELRESLEEALDEKNSLATSHREMELQLRMKLKEKTEVTCNLENEIASNRQVIAERDQNVENQRGKISDLKSELKILKEKFKYKNEILNCNLNDNGTTCNGVEHDCRDKPDELLISVSDNDKLLLQQKLKALDLEKSQLLFVLNEKSQECSSLKSEVHRLTNIVASEKQALFKLQKDNHELRQVQESNLDMDLTKQALQNLSRLVRDKDVEIEALLQKNNTLTDVIQQSTTGTEQVQSLIDERDELSKKLNKSKMEREKFMATYNVKDQECRKQSSEIKRLQTELEPLREKMDLLQTQHQTLAQQYEDKQKILLNVQNEAIILKQRLTSFEQNELDTKSKYSELMNEMNSNSAMSKEEIVTKADEIEKLSATIKDKDDLIHEKDCFIHDLSQQVKSLKGQVEDQNKGMESLKMARGNQERKLSESESAIKRVWDDKEALNQKLQDKQSELSLLREMNERLNITLKEREFFVQSLEEKISSLSIVIRGNVDSPSESNNIDQIFADSKEMFSKAQTFRRERDETLLALSQSQQEQQELKNEIQKLKTNESHLKGELDRLRKHLLEIEENYTNEALKAEVREKELRSQIVEVERNAKLSKSVVMESSQQASVQVASLQEQIAMIAGQRDRALEQLSSLEDKVQQYAASLSNLQLVLEQMQKGNEQKMREAEVRHQSELKKVKQQCLQLSKEMEMKEMQLEESSRALEAASRLSEQLDAKEDLIVHLKNEVRRADGMLKSTALEIDSIRNSSEGKVDRLVMKSLVLGYFSTPAGQKTEVVRLLARVLDFNQQEMAKAGIVVGKNSGAVVHKGILSSLFGRLPSLSGSQESEDSKSNSDQQPQTQSFASLFVRFLETESQPIVPIPLPAEKMARELTSKAQAHRNSPQKHLWSSTPEKNSLLLGVSSSFPTFSPIPTIKYQSPAPTILQEVLE